MRSRADILAKLPWSPDRGLTAEAVARSRQLFGANRLTPLARAPLWRNFLEKFDEPIIKILLGAALLSMVIDLCKADPLIGGLGLGFTFVLLAGSWLLGKTPWVPRILFASAMLLFLTGLALGHILAEGLAVMIAVTLATGVAFASEYKSQREFEILNANKDALRAMVLRDGTVHAIAMEDVVVGDVLLLEMGDEVTADGRLLTATELYIDQSLMTGESEPVRKHVHAGQSLQPDADVRLERLTCVVEKDGPDQDDCLYRGTQVADGVGRMIVTEVGDDTYLGQIARKLSEPQDSCRFVVSRAQIPGEREAINRETDQERVQRKLTIDRQLTPLQLKLKNLADLISKVGYVAAILIFLAQLVRGILVHEIFIPHDWPGTVSVFGELIGYFVTMVIIIVVAVPEGLPMSVTISLALAMREMTRANCLIRQLVACETIGSATVICSDKTGTLTQNKMRVELIDPAQASEWIVLNAAVNSTANLEEKDGQVVAAGNSTEGALLHWLRARGIDHAQLRREFEPLYQLHFSSERQRMTSVIARGQLVTLVKGSPEWLLEHCRRFQADDGSVQPMNRAMKAAFQKRIEDVAGRAMRILAFAYGPLPPGTPSDKDALHDRRDTLEKELIYVGFAAIRDPLRADVKEAIAECRRAGIAVKMVTGDNVETARAIGHEIGLLAHADEPMDMPGAAVLTSTRFNELADDQLKPELAGMCILARAKPLDKLRLVRLLQELGEVVAVTGDGTNDAPALKRADVGLAMGIAGTEVAKEASKIVLLDDAFSTIVRAVRWGRSRYENIQRFLQFQLTINLSALTITFLGILLFNVKAPFTVLQLLWINVIMDTLASIALCSEPPRPGVLDMPPKRRDESILTPAMLRTIFTTGSFFVVVMLLLLLLMKGDPDAPGLFAGPGPWSVETAGNRLALERADLERRHGNWYVSEHFRVSALRGQEARVDFTVFQVSLFFSIYVFFQVWNQINCRSLLPGRSGLARLTRNPTFIGVALAVAVGQVAIVTFGGKAFKVQPLGPWVWLGVIGSTASVLVFAELVRWFSWKPKGRFEP